MAVTGGRVAGAGPGLPVPLVALVLVLVLAGAVHSGPVQTEEEVHQTDGQVLRRVAAWLDSEEDQRHQQQRVLNSIQEQIDRMALELERLETKMDLKMDRLQEVLIGRDVKWDETSRRQQAQLDRTGLLLTEVLDRLQRADASVKGNLDNANQKIATLQGQVQHLQTNVAAGVGKIERMLTQQPLTGDVANVWASDVIPELRRMADDVERLQQADLCREGGASNAEEAQGRPAGGTGRDGTKAAKERGSGAPGGRQAGREDDGTPPGQEVESTHPALRLLEAMEDLGLRILSFSEQLNEGLEWLDERVGNKFRRLKEILAMMTASLRSRFVERRDHLEEVAEKLIRLQSVAVDGGEGPAVTNGAITALETAIYNAFDTEFWYILSKKLDEAISGQGNLTEHIGQMDRDMHQGFSKLYARLTRLTFNLKPAPDQPRDPGTSAELATQLRDMFDAIGQQLHEIQLTLADQQAT